MLILLKVDLKPDPVRILDPVTLSECLLYLINVASQKKLFPYNSLMRPIHISCIGKDLGNGIAFLKILLLNAIQQPK